jgi:hypothetical protein
MAEIKSTLDIVLEKTKHLALSAEEKVEMKVQEGLKKVPGYVERLLDLTLTPDRQLRKSCEERLEALRQSIAAGQETADT